MGLHIEEAEARLLFRTIDVDRSGFIEFQELKRLCAEAKASDLRVQGNLIKPQARACP